MKIRVKSEKRLAEALEKNPDVMPPEEFDRYAGKEYEVEPHIFREMSAFEFEGGILLADEVDVIEE